MVHIVLAFSHDDTALKIRRMLDGTGYEPDNVSCHTAAELLRTVESYDNVLVIMGYKLPDMVVDGVAEYVHSGCRIMSIVRADHIEDISNDEIFVLPLPISRAKLVSSVNMLLGAAIRVKEKHSVHSEAEQKLIDEAKIFLMENYHMTEQQAHRFMQKRSMDSGSKMIDTARLILGIDD